MKASLKSFITQYSLRVNKQLQQNMPSRIPGGERLLQAMSYSLLSPGKRVRPILAYASAVACGGNTNTPALDASACALECIHAYSLIHDDLPSMDDDNLRRGEPTCHIAFDEATAILAGDALQCHAFQLLANLETSSKQIVALFRELTHASGALGMVTGQAIDIAMTSRQPNIESLQSMHQLKTGALIEASVCMGAISIGVKDTQKIHNLRNYAKAIGLSFQVQDDILDVVSDTQTLGKTQGSDQERNKPTYVTLLGLKGAQNKAQELHQQALQAIASFGDSAETLRDLSAYIIERQA